MKGEEDFPSHSFLSFSVRPEEAKEEGKRATALGSGGGTGRGGSGAPPPNPFPPLPASFLGGGRALRLAVGA